MISDDLVNSYHLLLCALDLVYGNALQCPNRKELLNPNFKGMLKKKVDLKYMRINIFCIWLCNSNSINVVCNNRLVNFVNNTLSREFDILWKYP